MRLALIIVVLIIVVVVAAASSAKTTRGGESRRIGRRFRAHALRRRHAAAFDLLRLERRLDEQIERRQRLSARSIGDFGRVARVFICFFLSLSEFKRADRKMPRALQCGARRARHGQGERDDGLLAILAPACRLTLRSAASACRR